MDYLGALRMFVRAVDHETTQVLDRRDAKHIGVTMSARARGPLLTRRSGGRRQFCIIGAPQHSLLMCAVLIAGPVISVTTTSM